MIPFGVVAVMIGLSIGWVHGFLVGRLWVPRWERPAELPRAEVR